jgi:hypothetical protein
LEHGSASSYYTEKSSESALRGVSCVDSSSLHQVVTRQSSHECRDSCRLTVTRTVTRPLSVSPQDVCRRECTPKKNKKSHYSLVHLSHCDTHGTSVCPDPRRTANTATPAHGRVGIPSAVGSWGRVVLGRGPLGLGVTHALTRSVGAGAGLHAAEASARLRPSAIGFTLRHASHTATQCAGARPCQTATEQAPALDGKEITRPQTGAHRRGWVCESALEPAADHGVQEAGGSGPRSR